MSWVPLHAMVLQKGTTVEWDSVPGDWKQAVGFASEWAVQAYLQPASLWSPSLHGKHFSPVSLMKKIMSSKVHCLLKISLLTLMLNHRNLCCKKLLHYSNISALSLAVPIKSCCLEETERPNVSQKDLPVICTVCSTFVSVNTNGCNHYHQLKWCEWIAKSLRLIGVWCHS